MKGRRASLTPRWRSEPQDTGRREDQDSGEEGSTIPGLDSASVLGLFLLVFSCGRIGQMLAEEEA
jgi:hypothetical protein